MPISLEIAPKIAQLLPSELPTETVRALYIHIPFCFHKCHYCDFYSITRQTNERMEHFVDLILQEAEQWTGSGGPTIEPRTIFFGGGTPTLLPVSAMKRMIEGLKTRIDLGNVNEWTVEANPATLSEEFAMMLRENGVNRISFGAQSFDLSELATLERHHDPDDVPRSIELARRAGFQRINLDLIYAIPGQTLQKWSDSLNAAIALNTDHVSCYGLTYEPNTPMAVRKRLGQFQEIEQSIELEMMWHTRRTLAAIGLSAYEISNYARAGEECRHNLVYWTGENYIGLGPSAASHVSGWRWKNRAHLGEWERGIEARRLPVGDVEQLSSRQRAGELAMLMLRLSDGVQFDDFAGRIGCDARELFVTQLADLPRHGLLVVNQSGFRLTEKGLNVADAVVSEFLEATA